MLLFRTSQVINLSATEANITLHQKANTPNDARLVIFRNTAPKTGNVAVAIGADWKGGSDVVLINMSTIIGDVGANGSNGAGGAGGAGSSGAGVGRTAGAAGSNGAVGVDGGTALLVDSNANVRVRLNNQGTIAGGAGGKGGFGGGGGGSGG